MQSDETLNLHQSDEAKYSDSLIHRDDVLWQLWINAEHSVDAMLSYIIRWTRYGAAYEEAFAKIRELQNEIHNLQAVLLACAKNEKGE